MQHIIIADAHAVCRAALENFILHATDDDIRVEAVGDYGSLIDLLSRKNTDLILLDHNLPGLPASAEDMDFRAECPGARVGIMTDRSFEKRESRDSVDIFPKSLPSKIFLDGIKKILSGQRFSAEEIFVENAHSQPNDIFSKPFDLIKFTQRERQVLSHLLTGAVNKDIARALELQVVTVKLHVRGICRKMGVKNRTQAALMAREYGWA